MTAFLECKYRMLFFSKMYVNSGESLGNMAKLLNYTGKGRNGPVREMWVGRKGIPDQKFDLCCKLAQEPIVKARSFIVPKSENKLVDDWVVHFRAYKENSLRK